MAEERYTYNKHTWENDELITKENLNNIEDGLARIAEPALGSIRFDSAQRLGEDEKEQARTNLGIAAGTVLTTENLSSGTALVSYGKEQTLEDSEKERARSNIDALGINDVSSHDDPLINLKEEINVSDYYDANGIGKCLYITNANFNKYNSNYPAYNVSGYIPVKSGCKLTFTNIPDTQSFGEIFYKADKKTVIKPGYSNHNLLTVNYIIVPENASWLRATYLAENPMIITQTTAAHDELVEKISDVVVIDDSESNTNDNTKLWIHATPEQEIQIPTMEDFNKLSGRIPTFDLTNESLDRLEEIDLNELANYSSEITTIQEKITSLENKTDTYHINVKNYGAAGDGGTNPNADDTKAFQDALKAIADGEYSELYIPTAHKEQYVIKDTLVFPRNLRKIYGDGTAHGSNTFGGIKFDCNNIEGTSDTSGHKQDIALFKYHPTLNGPQMLHITNLNFASASLDGNSRLGLFLDATSTLVDKDIEFSNCMITNFYRVFNFKGRGLSVINSYITSSNYIATINWEDELDSNINHPRNMDQRAIYFKNNRLHSITNGVLRVASGHAYGLTFQNNTIDDGKGYLISAANEAWNWIIQGNLLQGIGKFLSNNAAASNNYYINFTQGCKNCIISNNLFSADPRYWVGDYDPQIVNVLGNFRWCNLAIATGTNISNNVFNFGYNSAIVADSLYGCIISNNNFVNTTFYSEVTPIYIDKILQGSSIIGNTFLYEYITFIGPVDNNTPTVESRNITYRDIIKNGYKNIAAKGCISLNTGTPINSTILGNNLTTTIPAEDLEEND